MTDVAMKLVPWASEAVPDVAGTTCAGTETCTNEPRFFVMWHAPACAPEGTQIVAFACAACLPEMILKYEDTAKVLPYKWLGTRRPSCATSS